MDLLLWVEARQPIPSSVDFEVSETSQGISFRLRGEAVEAIAAGVSSRDPFEAFDAGVDDVDTPTERYVDIKIGTVNDLADGGGLTVTGEEASPPAGYWRFAIPASTTYYIVIQATINADGTVPDASLYLDATPDLTAAGNSSTGEPPANAYRKICKLETDGDYVLTITQYTTGAQQAFVVVSDWACAEITKNVLWLP